MSGSRSSGHSGGGNSGNSGNRRSGNSGGRSGNSNAAAGGTVCCCLFFNSGNKNGPSCSSGGGGNYKSDGPQQQYMGEEKIQRDYVALPGGSSKSGHQASAASDTMTTPKDTFDSISAAPKSPVSAAPIVEPSAPYMRMSSEGIPQEPQIEGQPNDLQPGLPTPKGPR